MGEQRRAAAAVGRYCGAATLAAKSEGTCRAGWGWPRARGGRIGGAEKCFGGRIWRGFRATDWDGMERERRWGEGLMEEGWEEGVGVERMNGSGLGWDAAAAGRASKQASSFSSSSWGREWANARVCSTSPSGCSESGSRSRQAARRVDAKQRLLSSSCFTRGDEARLMLRARRAAGLAGLPARPGYHTIPIQTHFPKVRARPIGDCRASRDTDRDAESTLRTVTEIGRLQRWLNRSTHRSCSCGPASAGVCEGGVRCSASEAS